jgi:hypothetical protein
VPLPADAPEPPPPDEDEPCAYCGVQRLVWRKCKLVCAACGNINKSCADL